MREEAPRFDQAGLRIVAIGQGTPEELGRFLSNRDYPFEVFTDPELASYRAYGLIRGGLWQVTLSPKVIAEGTKAAAQGHVATQPVGDVKQLPGSFVISDGVIVFAHRGRLSSDVASPEALLAALG